MLWAPSRSGGAARGPFAVFTARATCLLAAFDIFKKGLTNPPSDGGLRKPPAGFTGVESELLANAWLRSCLESALSIRSVSTAATAAGTTPPPRPATLNRATAPAVAASGPSPRGPRWPPVPVAAPPAVSSPAAADSAGGGLLAKAGSTAKEMGDCGLVGSAAAASGGGGARALGGVVAAARRSGTALAGSGRATLAGSGRATLGGVARRGGGCRFCCGTAIHLQDSTANWRSSKTDRTTPRPLRRSRRHATMREGGTCSASGASYASGRDVATLPTALIACAVPASLGEAFGPSRSRDPRLYLKQAVPNTVLVPNYYYIRTAPGMAR